MLWLWVCYGRSQSSPYTNPIDCVSLNRQIYNYQNFQILRNNDQQKIKKTRLTPILFSPTIEKQAKKIINFAEKNAGKKLILSLLNSNGEAHAVFLSAQSDGKIQYMDANNNAYLFDEKQQFIHFYIHTLKKDNYQFYRISELRYDPNNNLKESLTLKGFIISCLTGKKYIFPNPKQLVLLIAAGTASIVLLGIFAQTFPVLLATIIIPALIIIISYLALTLLAFTTGRVPFTGLLTVPYYIKSKMYEHKQKDTEKASYALNATISHTRFFSKKSSLNLNAPPIKSLLINDVVSELSLSLI